MDVALGTPPQLPSHELVQQPSPSEGRGSAAPLSTAQQLNNATPSERSDGTWSAPATRPAAAARLRVSGTAAESAATTTVRKVTHRRCVGACCAAQAGKVWAVGIKRRHEGGPASALKRRKADPLDSEAEAMPPLRDRGVDRPQSKMKRAYAGVGGRIFARAPSVYLRAEPGGLLSYDGGANHSLDHGGARATLPVTMGGEQCEELAYFEVTVKAGAEHR
jgi:hypothetical protein